MKTMTIPKTVRTEIARRAGAVPSVLLPEDHEEFLETVEPQFRYEANEVFDDAVRRDVLAREERRDRQLNELVAMVSKITRLVSSRAPTTVFNPATETSEPELMITVRDVARHLGVCVRTVHRLTAAGELPPPSKIGRTSRWSTGDVSAYLKKVRTTRPNFSIPSLSRAG